MKHTYIISVLWGRSCVYHPTSTPKICWDGKLLAENGTLHWLDRLNYRFLGSSQGEEISYPIHNAQLPTAFRRVGTWYQWKSDITPGDPGSMEGLRFELEGDEDTVHLRPPPGRPPVRLRLPDRLYRVGQDRTEARHRPRVLPF